jgi:lipopolysaccharide transport system permease protein
MSELAHSSPVATPAPVARHGPLTDLAEVRHELWSGRSLLYQLTLRDIRIRYKQAVMGFGWAVFMPILIVGAGCLVRLAVVYASGGKFDRATLLGLAVKSIGWAFFVGAVGFATTSLTTNMQLVTKVYFPREVLPLSSVLAQCFDGLIAATALVVAIPFIGSGHWAGLVWLPILAILLVTFTAATCLFLSCANLFFRDVKYIVQVLLTFGIFFTPVFFEPAMFGRKGAMLLMLNPLAPILEGMRVSLVLGHNLLAPLDTAAGIAVWRPWYLAYSAAWAIIGLIGSTVMFHRSEYVFAEYV